MTNMSLMALAEKGFDNLTEEERARVERLCSRMADGIREVVSTISTHEFNQQRQIETLQACIEYGENIAGAQCEQLAGALGGPVRSVGEGIDSLIDARKRCMDGWTLAAQELKEAEDQLCTLKTNAPVRDFLRLVHERASRVSDANRDMPIGIAVAKALHDEERILNGELEREATK